MKQLSISAHFVSVKAGCHCADTCLQYNITVDNNNKNSDHAQTLTLSTKEHLVVQEMLNDKKIFIQSSSKSCISGASLC